MITFNRGVLALILIGGILAGLILGLLIGWVLWPVDYFNTDLSDLSTQHKEDYITMVAAAYALDGNLEEARGRLEQLGAPNITQLVSVQVDRYIAAGRNDAEVTALARLVKGLGGDTVKLAKYLATATPTPTQTPRPTATPTQTATFTVTPTFTPTPIPPTATPVPPTGTATATVVPPTATATARPPTATQKPATQAPAVPPTPVPATHTPVPAGPPYVVESVRLRPIGLHAQNCAGGDHYIAVTVLDGANNPIDGVRVREVFTGQVFLTGSKGPGLTQFDIWAGGGGQVQIVDEGNNPISDTSRGMSADWPDFDLMKGAGYCTCKPHPDDASCQSELASHSYLFAKSHYVYEVVIKRR